MNVKKLNTCCFIGDGNQNNQQLFEEKTLHFIGTKLRIEKMIVNLIESLYVTNFISGMDIGFEQCASEIVLKKKEMYPQITLEGVLPYELHSINWTGVQRNKYYSIMEKCDREILLQYHYTDDCIRRRNQYMINKSKYIIFFQKSTSNIDDLILYARLKKRNIMIIDSDEIQHSRNESIF